MSTGDNYQDVSNDPSLDEFCDNLVSLIPPRFASELLDIGFGPESQAVRRVKLGSWFESLQCIPTRGCTNFLQLIDQRNAWLPLEQRLQAGLTSLYRKIADALESFN